MSGWPAPAAPIRRYYTADCFVCGVENAGGCRAPFLTDGSLAWTETRLPVNFTGFADLVHGGVITALLDEAMWYACFAAGVFAVTTRLEVAFRRPLEPEREVRVEARCLRAERRLMIAEARLLAADGVITAEASGRFLPAPASVRHAEQQLRVEEPGPGRPRTQKPPVGPA